MDQLETIVENRKSAKKKYIIVDEHLPMIVDEHISQPSIYIYHDMLKLLQEK